MRDNPIQFAVVREDPTIEFDLVATRNCQRVLVIGSGGCTALSLQAKYPHLAITVVDPNPAQLGLVREKLRALAETKAGSAERRKLFNIGDDDPKGLNARGNFESLFRGLRDFIREYLLSADELSEMFASDESLRAACGRLFTHRYWPVAFSLFFSDPLLLAMFGPAAIQHAAPGSYPGYFRELLEHGLRAPGGYKNYFLHHIFLGSYREDWLPYYLAHPTPVQQTVTALELIEASAAQYADYGSHDLVSLSNIFDWMPEAEIAPLAERVASELKPGALLVYRQLNHAKTFEALFGPRLRFDAVRSEQMRLKDRSLFYSRLNVGVRT